MQETGVMELHEGSESLNKKTLNRGRAPRSRMSQLL